MRILSLLSLVLLSAAAAAVQTGRISGKVTFSDGTVIHSAIVRIVELNKTATTDDYGEYSFNNVPPGKYTLTAHQEGFDVLTKTVTVGVDGAAADFQLALAGVKAEVTVTASGSEQSTFESIATVSTLGANQILERASVGLGDVLENEAGVAKRSSGPGNSRPVIRGFDGDRVLVSTDGVRVGSLASQSGDHAEPVDALAAERIEVVKGPATLLYGSSAIGGVVNAISGHDEGAHPGFRGYLSGIGGTNNAQGASSLGLEYGVGNWVFWGNASGQRTSDYKAGGDFGRVQNTFTRNAAGSFGGGYFARKAFFNTTYSYYQNRYGIPFDPDNSELRSLRMWRNNTKVNIGYNDADLPIKAIKLTLDLSNYRHQEMADEIVGTTFHNNVFSFRAMMEQKIYGSLSGRFGFEGFHRHFETVGEEMLVDGPVKQDSFSVFALEELKFERVTMQLGARVENNRYRPDNPALRPRDLTGFSGAAGIRFDLWKGGAFVANYSHSVRAPALDELYNNGPHDGTIAYEIGDPNLTAETSNGIDLSLRHQSGRLTGEANFYYYDLSNFIYLAPTNETDKDSGLEIAEYRQGNSRFYGTELSLDTKLNRYANILTGLDYVNAKLKNGPPLPRIAPLRGRIGLDLHFNSFSVRPEFVAVGDQDRVFINETPTPGYGVVNIAASYILSTRHAAHIFSVNGYNLGNRLFYNHISFIKDISPEIGRGFRFGYTVRFF
ncbi:MAG: TonB-dependent receptor [Acidobacteriota bacterium]